MEAALKTSSSFFSTGELRKRLVSANTAEAPQRSFPLHRTSAGRANLARSHGATGEAWAQPPGIPPLGHTLGLRPSRSLASGGPAQRGTSNIGVNCPLRTGTPALAAGLPGWLQSTRSPPTVSRSGRPADGVARPPPGTVGRSPPHSPPAVPAGARRYSRPGRAGSDGPAGLYRLLSCPPPAPRGGGAPRPRPPPNTRTTHPAQRAPAR